MSIFIKRPSMRSVIRGGFFIVIILSLFSFAFYYKNENGYTLVSRYYEGFKRKTVKCNLPKLSPWSEEVTPYFKNLKPPSLKCPDVTLFTQGRGELNGRLERVVNKDFKNCCYRPSYRVNDINSTLDERCIPLSKKFNIIPPEYEFIRVECINGEDNKTHVNSFSFVTRKPEIEERLASSRRTQRNQMSVLVLGLDSMSHMNFQRMMPKSHDFLVNKLSSIALNGYTKTGGLTFPNLAAVLMGMTDKEFYTRCSTPIQITKGGFLEWGTDSRTIQIDSCNFVWKEFKRNGYITGYSEDEMKNAFMQLHFDNAFAHPPTDYYFRPYGQISRELWTSDRDNKYYYCFNNRLTYEPVLDQLESIASIFKSDPYFHFAWISKIQHDRCFMAEILDDPVLKTLTYLMESQSLNNTALIVLGDHGNSYDPIINTKQGSAEHNLPVFYIALPSWFNSSYPNAFANLKINSNRLLSTFDLHHTFSDFMNLDRLNEPQKWSSDWHKLDRHPVGIFDEISLYRTCEQGGIATYFCTCNLLDGAYTSIPLDSGAVVSAVEYSVAFLNYFLRDKSKECAKFSLFNITNAYRMHFESITSNEIEIDKDFNYKTVTVTLDDKERMLLKVSFIVNPSNASFEAQLLREESGDKGWTWHLTNQIERTNQYGNQSECVEERKFKPFCYCVL